MSTLQVTNLQIQTVNAEVMVANSIASNTTITVNGQPVTTSDEATALSIALG